MSKDEELEIVKYALQEIKDQYQICLDGFDDRKEKVRIFLIVCSLIITIPLSSEFIMIKIFSLQNWMIGVFMSGIFLLVITIIVLIRSITGIQIKIPAYTHILESIGKYKTQTIMKSVAKAYARDLNINMIKAEKKIRLIKIAENFIISGVLLVLLPLMYALLFR